MKKIYFLVLCCALLFSWPLRAQEFRCGTVSPAPKEMKAYQALLQRVETGQGNQKKDGAIVYLPIKPWIIRKSDGSGSLTEMEVMRGMVAANQHFLKAGIQFYVCGTFGYIKDDRFYDLNSEDDPQLPTVPNAINVYYTHSATVKGGLRRRVHLRAHQGCEQSRDYIRSCR